MRKTGDNCQWCVNETKREGAPSQTVCTPLVLLCMFSSWQGPWQAEPATYWVLGGHQSELSEIFGRASVGELGCKNSIVIESCQACWRAIPGLSAISPVSFCTSARASLSFSACACEMVAGVWCGVLWWWQWCRKGWLVLREIYCGRHTSRTCNQNVHHPRYYACAYMWSYETCRSDSNYNHLIKLFEQARLWI